MAGFKFQRANYREAHHPSRRWHLINILKQAAFLSASVAAVAFLLVLVAVSPLAFRQLDSLPDVNWTQLSAVGQTYGAASALLTGLALIGVAGSIMFQIRAIRASQEQSIREQHTHLIEMALADPIYLRVWGYDPGKYGNPEKYRQSGYTNLIVSFWQSYYVLGGLRENAVRTNIAFLFRGEAGREFWAASRNERLQAAQNRRDIRFCHMMEEEYQKAVTAGPSVVQVENSLLTPPASRQLMLRDSATKSAITLLLGAIGGIAFEAFWRRRRR
jgi:hypothetical protein